MGKNFESVSEDLIYLKVWKVVWRTAVVSLGVNNGRSD